MQQTITRFSVCLLGLLGLTLFASPVTAQVFDSGTSDSTLFDRVLTTSPGSDRDQSVGGDGLTTQLSIFNRGVLGINFDANSGSEVNISGGTVDNFFDANSGSEVNISGGSVGTHFNAESGSEINISGGTVGDFFDANSDSKVNISGGSVGAGFRAFSESAVNISGGLIGDNFHAFRESTINLYGREFILDGVSLGATLRIDNAFTINDRDVVLSGRLADGSAFSFDLNSSVFPPNTDQDFFRPDATLTVTLVSTPPTNITYVPLFTFDGDSAGDQFGRVVSGAGDVNGDGVNDVIVGADDDNNGRDSGSARVLSGSDGSVLYSFEGESRMDYFGFSVSGAGDVNGDGFDDLIVGALGVGDDTARRGCAWVYSGVDGSILYKFDGDGFDDRLGRSVSGAGDVYGDGFDDVIVGAVGENNNSGSVRVYSGVDGSVLYKFDGDSPDDNFGNSVSDAGDVNGDGFADLIVGTIGDDNNGAESGGARVLSGFDGSVLYNFDGDSPWDRFGVSVSGAGDVNGDGFDDLIVGANGDSNKGQTSGSARVFSGVDGSILYTFNGDSIQSSLGGSVSGAGDVNGDGFDDLIVGAIGIRNNGFQSGGVRMFSGVDGSIVHSFDGDSVFDAFGTSVSGVGDVNDDGIPDFIVGAANGLIDNIGYARLFVSQISAPILGDCNQDGEVNFLDINPFIELLASNTYLEQADCNQDGVLNFLDIAPFIAILSGN